MLLEPTPRGPRTDNSQSDTDNCNGLAGERSCSVHSATGWLLLPKNELQRSPCFYGHVQQQVGPPAVLTPLTLLLTWHRKTMNHATVSKQNRAPPAHGPLRPKSSLTLKQETPPVNYQIYLCRRGVHVAEVIGDSRQIYSPKRPAVRQRQPGSLRPSAWSIDPAWEFLRTSTFGLTWKIRFKTVPDA